VESLTLCFFVKDEPPRDQWRFSATSQPVMQHAKYVSRAVRAKVHAAHTTYGLPELVKLLEAYLCRYALGDGWFGPISEETMRNVFLLVKNEGAAFLEATPLE
jgi:hypothetical protein